jgi:hypothetical protein
MWTRALERVARLADDRLLTFPRLIDRLADQYDTAPALLADGETWSYRTLAQRCNRYAHWALAEGLKKGDGAALLMGNCPDYLAIWLGLTRVGISVALVNTGLAGSAPAHSLNAVRPSHVIVADALVEALRRALPHCASPPRCWSFGPNRCGWPRIDDAVCSLPEGTPAVADAAMRSLNFKGHPGLGRGESVPDPGRRIALAQLVEQRLVGDLARKPDVARADPMRLRAHQRAAPMRRRSRDMGDPASAGAAEKRAGRLGGVRQHQRAAPDDGPQKDLQSAIAADVVERAPHDRLSTGGRRLDRREQAGKRMPHQFRQAGGARSQQNPFAG